MEAELGVRVRDECRFYLFEFLDSPADFCIADIAFRSCEYQVVLEMPRFRSEQASVKPAEFLRQTRCELCEPLAGTCFDQCTDE